jgi:hypothetical protein
MKATRESYSASKGRRFAVTLAIAFGLLGVIAWWRGKQTLPLVLAIVAAVFVLAAIAIPSRLEPVERAWMAMARGISKITTPVFMGIVYFLVLTPIGILRRTLGRNPVVHEARDGSYWIARTDAEGDIRRKRMERQF